MTTVGKNVAMQMDGDELVIRVNVTKTFGKSKSGKTTIVATTEGNISLPEPHEEIKMGLNIYKK